MPRLVAALVTLSACALPTLALHSRKISLLIQLVIDVIDTNFELPGTSYYLTPSIVSFSKEGRSILTCLNIKVLFQVQV